MNKRNRKISALMAMLMCLFFVTGCNETAKAPEITDEIKAEIQKYNDEANEDGITIVDMDSNPYFMEKQAGVEYNSADTITYYSDVTKNEREAKVLLPVNYDEDKEYPVLYMLHGLGGSHNTWIRKDADIIIQNLIYFENVPEMIVVFPNSEVNESSNADDLEFSEKVKVYDLTEKDLVENLMPYINENYSVKEGKENTAIAGNSMGGRNTLNTAFKHQDLFGYVGAFSSAKTVKDSRSSSVMNGLLDDFVIEENGGFEKILICVGRQDDVCGAESYIIDDRLTQNNIEHVFYDTEGGHQNVVWQNALYNYLKMIFVK